MGLLKKKNAEAKPAPSGPQGVGSVSLLRYSTLIFLANTLILVLVVALLYSLVAADEGINARERAEVSGKIYAQRVERFLRNQGEVVQSATRLPGLAELIASADAARIRAREQEIQLLIPAAARVRLLRAGHDETDSQGNPPLGFAGLSLLREIERGVASPPVEVHQSGTPQEHFDLIAPVRGGNDRILGHVFVQYPAARLNALLEGGEARHARLRQEAGPAAAVIVAALGDASLGSSTPGFTQAVKGTTWTLEVWPVAGGVMGLGDMAPYAIALGGSVVILLGVVMLVFRALGRALRDDQVMVINLVKDLMARNLSGSYPVKLSEMRGTVQFLVNLSPEFGRFSGVGAGKAPAARSAAAGGAEAQPSAAEAKVPASIFRAYDIRGVMGKTLTPQIVHEIGRAIGSEAYERGQQTLVVARDGRTSGPELVEALCKGLQSTGRDVIDIGMVPTPVMYFATQHLGVGSGVIVTGSHNPPDYNGLKIVLRGEALHGDAIVGLRQRIISGNVLSGRGERKTIDVLGDYVQRIANDVRPRQALKVVVDCGSGVAGVVAPSLFKALGLEVIPLYCDVDGRFPHHHPDPSDPKNLLDLSRKVLEEGADLGIAFDGDGDRLGVVDSLGKTIWADRQMILFARDVLSRQSGADIIFDVKCTRNLPAAIQKAGGRPVMWKTGHSLIKAKMKETGAMLAGEMSGHIFFKERWYGFDDALYAAARLIEILAADPRSSAEVFDDVPDSPNTPELRIDVREGDQHALIEKLVAAPEVEGAEVSTIDGLRADFPDGFGLIRASNTTPSLILRFEGDNAAALARIQGLFKKKIQVVAPKLKLPF